MDVLIDSLGGIISQCILTLNVHFFHFQYLTIVLYINK